MLVISNKIRAVAVARWMLTVSLGLDWWGKVLSLFPHRVWKWRVAIKELSLSNSKRCSVSKVTTHLHCSHGHHIYHLVHGIHWLANQIRITHGNVRGAGPRLWPHPVETSWSPLSHGTGAESNADRHSDGWCTNYLDSVCTLSGVYKGSVLAHWCAILQLTVEPTHSHICAWCRSGVEL